jgi:hypothetical protein
VRTGCSCRRTTSSGLRLTCDDAAAQLEDFDTGPVRDEAAQDLSALNRATGLDAQCGGGEIDHHACDERLGPPTIGLDAAANLDFANGLAHLPPTAPSAWVTMRSKSAMPMPISSSVRASK